MVKRLFVPLICAVGIQCFAGTANNPIGIALENGTIRAVYDGEVIFDGDFRAKEPDWVAISNYSNKLSQDFETMNGRHALVIRNKTKEGGDNAWNFISRMIPLTKTGKKLVIEVACCATTNIAHASGGPQYSTYITWYDKVGKVLSINPFRYNASPVSFVTSQIILSIPDNAVSFRIQLGADNPNTPPGGFQAYASLRALVIDEPPKYVLTASFTTPMFPVTTGQISWKADLPEGTELALQLSTAQDIDDRPGPWSVFAGPDGTPNSFFRNGDAMPKFASGLKWLRAKVILTGGVKTPIIHELVIGNHTERDWTAFYDAIPPVVQNTTEISSNRSKKLSVRIMDESPINWKTLRFFVDGRDVTEKTVRNGATISYRTDNPFDKDLHCFLVHVADIEGNTVDAKRYFSFVEPTKSNRVTLRDDGMTLIGGKPFFPIGIYAIAKKPWNNDSYDAAFRMIKEAGFNLAHTYCITRNKSFYNEFLPAAAKYGIRLYIAGPNGENNHDINQLLNIVREERANPWILSWYLADDTSGNNTPALLAELSDAVRAVDPDHLISQADEVRGYPGFANSTDVFLPEIYPVRKIGSVSSEQCVAQTIADMKTTFSIIAAEGRPNVGVWAIIQYFKGWGAWQRFPTPEELRAMSYVSIVHGAHGIIWYTYGPGDHIKNFGAASSPEHWANMSKVSKELNALAPIFCERKSPQPPKPRILSGPAKDPLGYDSISCLLKKHDGKTYLICVNSSKQPVKASFFLKGLTGGKVLFENRSINLSDDLLTDEFASYAVHVYELK